MPRLQAQLFVIFISLGAFGQEPARLRAAPATPLSGPSWLRAVAISVDGTPLGHLGGSGPPHEGPDGARFRESVRRAVSLAGQKDGEAQRYLDVPFALDGEALYRFNCRACHGPLGDGLPPEVGSIVGMAGSLSPAMIEENMRAKGVTVRPNLAVELSRQADQALRDRLRHGGKEMPPFKHLSDPEIAALVDYLETLAGVPRPRHQAVQVAATALRVGEQVVQGTCRICHDATGPGAGHQMMMSGRIPALANLPEQLSLEGVVHKARYGWSGLAGVMHKMSRMPIFEYLSDEEVAAAYLYLAYYPPAQVN